VIMINEQLDFSHLFLSNLDGINSFFIGSQEMACFVFDLSHCLFFVQILFDHVKSCLEG
jgi:hypothetical protein